MAWLANLISERSVVTKLNTQTEWCKEYSSNIYLYTHEKKDIALWSIKHIQTKKKEEKKMLTVTLTFPYKLAVFGHVLFALSIYI